ncbi:hypothetical protein GCM10010182_04100 [Actinomadura cremea]|nr:hypothetical protein GCM10010182_04100 [Actinomadura cremea]
MRKGGKRPPRTFEDEPRPAGALAVHGGAVPTAHAATTPLLAGIPVHLVAARLAHAEPAITLRVYAHVVRSAETAAADVFSGRLAKVNGGGLVGPCQQAR